MLSLPGKTVEFGGPSVAPKTLSNSSAPTGKDHLHPPHGPSSLPMESHHLRPPSLQNLLPAAAPHSQPPVLTSGNTHTPRHLHEVGGGGGGWPQMRADPQYSTANRGVLKSHAHSSASGKVFSAWIHDSQGRLPIRAPSPGSLLPPSHIMTGYKLTSTLKRTATPQRLTAELEGLIAVCIPMPWTI